MVKLSKKKSVAGVGCCEDYDLDIRYKNKYSTYSQIAMQLSRHLLPRHQIQNVLEQPKVNQLGKHNKVSVKEFRTSLTKREIKQLMN